ncbi:MAG: FABP family protein [Pseudonocardiales bacterium]
MTDPGYPYPESHDLRAGPDLHHDLLPLLPYVGMWRGTGKVGYPTIEDRDYAQEVRFSHDGRPFLAYESRAWLIDDDGRPVKPSAREVGWWRPGAGDSELEVLVVHPTGIAENYYGHVNGLQVELATDAVVRTATAKVVTAMRRLYGIVEGDLMYAVDMAAVGQPLQAHLSARLIRI